MADRFDVKIFEPNGCEKIDEGEEEQETTEDEEAEDKDDDAEEEEELEEEKLVERKRGKGKARERTVDIYGADLFRSGAYTQPANPYFVTRARGDRKDMVYIPADIVKELKYEARETLNVRDQRGRAYTLKLKGWDDGRKWYRDGWRRLCDSNLVGRGDRIICEFIERDEQQSVEMQINNIVRAGNSSN